MWQSVEWSSSGLGGYGTSEYAMFQALLYTILAPYGLHVDLAGVFGWGHWRVVVAAD